MASVRRRAILVSVLIAGLAILAASASGARTPARQHAAAGPFKVAWIYVGPHNDHGWSQSHNAGRLAVQKALGSKVETTYKENVPEGSQTTQVIESLVRDGNKLIFGTSFGFQEAMVKAAAKHPDVDFEMATGSETAKNLATYYGAGEDALYLSGMAAGMATKTGKLGDVVPFPTPEIIRQVNAFTLGAQRTHPGATVRLIWTQSWFNPAAESKAAQSLVGSGVDVLAQEVDGPATGQAAGKAKVAWVGYDSNAASFAPKSWLTALTYDWSKYYIRRVKAAMNGTWKTGQYYGGLGDGFVNLAPYGSSVTPKTKAMIAKVRAQLGSGSFYEFQGPLYDQAGKLRVPKGKKLSLPQILSMEWFVKGVEGSVKG
jgi:basic membrane protein A and related proteins